MASKLNFDPRDKESCMKLLETLTSNAPFIQQQVLGEILAKNANTEYLKGFLLDGSEDDDNIEHFKNRVPLVAYEDMKPYFDRIVSGEASSAIISAEPITELFISSGTSCGKHKLLPSTAEEAGRRGMYQFISAALLNMHIEGLNKGRIMLFTFTRPDIETPNGLIITYATCSFLKNLKPTKELNPFDGFSSPIEVILCTETKQSIFCQLLCSLVRRFEVVRVGSSVASLFVWGIKFLEENWQEICANIRTGQISEWITEPNCRKAVSSILNKEMPDLADKVDEIFREQSWEGIVKKLWPNTKIVDAISTGTMAQYVPLVNFYSGGLPLVSMHYVCSEGFFGLNLEPLTMLNEDVSYTLLPNMAYFEFLPVDQKEEENDDLKGEDVKNNELVVDLANVKVGQKYELIVTTFTGLYRYRVGDILLPTGFYNKAPKFKFIRRQNVVLSIDIEKTTEEDLFKAITNAMKILEANGFFLSDYTSYVNASKVPYHYVLFWELQMRRNGEEQELDGVQMEKCCAVVEQSLDATYRMLRNRRNAIGPLEIKVVNPGTFQKLMDFFVSEGSSVNQYKTPKCIKVDKAIELLNSSVMGTYSSKCIPTYN